MVDKIVYDNEHLWPGIIGQGAVFMSFCAALLAAVAYYFATRHRHEQALSQSWRNIGRGAFIVHALSLFTVIGLLFFIMVNKYYEYQYVQAHVSDDLSMRYVFSAFWEGQEGSFLLWTFWHAVLGLLLIPSAKTWESPVMSVVAGVQVILGSMLLGVYVGFGDWAMRMGSNPMLLLRDVMDAPIFSNPDYVAMLEGTGLNPLLQNWWMTIHPPTLFLGFASTVVPFAFALAGLWTRDHEGWLQPAMPWALMSGAILGTGILMGGAWAYEALNFGGYWAWDPVENMSLVPWLTLIAGIHTNLVARSTGHSIRASYVFYALTFALVVYSSYLTRSGVLGETSVHAFTGAGMGWQLLTFLGLSFLLPGILLARTWKAIPTIEKEEATASKEFWLFIGSLVLLFSTALITFPTSLPVFNKIVQWFDPVYDGAVIDKPVPFYNKYQLWIGIFVGLLSGFSQYLRFREVNFVGHRRKFLTHLLVAVGVAAVATYASMQVYTTGAWQYVLLLFSGWFAVVANIDHIITFLRGNLKLAGSSFSHIGFGLMLVGIVASGLSQRIISKNPFLMEGLTEDEQAKRNAILLIQGTPNVMGNYRVTLTGDRQDGLNRTYTVNFQRLDENGRVTETFDLHPNVLYDKSLTKIAASNPDTKRYWGRDIFTFIPALPPEEISIEDRQAKEDSLQYAMLDMGIGEQTVLFDTIRIQNPDTFTVRSINVKVLDIQRRLVNKDYKKEPGDLAIAARLEVKASDADSTFVVESGLVLRDQLVYTYPAQINPINTRLKLSEASFDQMYVPENELDYQPYELAEGDSINWQGHTLRFKGYDRQAKHPDYQPQQGDIAVGAVLEIRAASGQVYPAMPIFIIRNQQILNIKDEVAALGLHAHFATLDPKTGKAKLMLAAATPRPPRVTVGVAPKAYRSDWIALQAIEFPGINFFWIGSSLMMLGLTIGMGYRIAQISRGKALKKEPS